MCLVSAPRDQSPRSGEIFPNVFDFSVWSLQLVELGFTLYWKNKPATQKIRIIRCNVYSLV